MYNKLYGVEFKESKGNFILISLKSDITKKSSNKIINLYKEYFEEEYPTFIKEENYLEINGDINALKRFIKEHFDILLNQVNDKRMKDIKGALSFIRDEASNNTVYLLYEGDEE